MSTEQNKKRLADVIDQITELEETKKCLEKKISEDNADDTPDIDCILKSVFGPSIMSMINSFYGSSDSDKEVSDSSDDIMNDIDAAMKSANDDLKKHISDELEHAKHAINEAITYNNARQYTKIMLPILNAVSSASAAEADLNRLLGRFSAFNDIDDYFNDDEEDDD